MNKRKIFIAVIVLLFIIAIPLTIYFMERNTAGPESTEKAGDYYRSMFSVELNGEKYLPNPDVKCWLVIGIDSFGKMSSSGSYNNSDQADFLALLIADSSKMEWSILHINRDTIAEVPILGVTGVYAGTSEGQLALAHTYGDGMTVSCENTVRAVKLYLNGTPIDGYICMNMDAVSIINDYCGGIEVSIPEDLTALDPSFISGADVTLNGELALEFVRARQSVSDGTNVSRMSRQRIYLDGLRNRLSEIKPDTGWMLKLQDKADGYYLTDCADDFAMAADILAGYSFKGIFWPEGETSVNERTGFMEFYPDRQNLESIVYELIYSK